MYSKAQARQSWIDLDFMKPYWFLWMRGMIRACSISAINFVINLSTEFRSEIGLKSLGVTGLLFLGMSVMKELLMACRLTVPEKKSLQS